MSFCVSVEYGQSYRENILKYIQSDYFVQQVFN